ncbi:MAG: peptide deformylase [Actinomycetota bacterium]|nr:peptide deformylase [Actinomycetota bacterium]
MLRQRARPVTEITDVHRRLIADMIDTMREAPGVGLAATQVGVVERIFVWEVGEEHGVIINPEIVERGSETETQDEGCLSLPGLLFPVERALDVVVEGLDENGQEVRIEASELQARVFQHELDHLNGVLFIDHLSDEDRRAARAALMEQALGLRPSG